MLNSFFNDDITFCGSSCDITDCFRHLSHKHKETKYYSCALFKGTEYCDYFSKEEKEVFNDRHKSKSDSSKRKGSSK